MTKTFLRAIRMALPVTLLAMSSIAHLHAQTDKGAFEVGIEAGPLLVVGTGGGEFIGDLRLSGEPHVDYFLTERLEVGVTGLFFHSFESGVTLPFLSFLGAYCHVNYHFNSGSPLSPYIGARIGVLMPDSETFFGLGPQIGLKYFVARQFSINLQLDGAAHPGSKGDVFLASLVLGCSYHIK